MTDQSLGFSFWSAFRDRMAQLPNAWTRIRGFFYVLKPIRFSVLMLIIGFLFLACVPQGQETLRTLAESGSASSPDWFKIMWFMAAATVWAFYSWYWARVMLYLHFPAEQATPIPPDSERAPAPDLPYGLSFEQLRNSCIKLPRWLGVSAFFATGTALFMASGVYSATENSYAALRLNLLALLSVILGVAFYLFTIYRRDAIHALHETLSHRVGAKSKVWRNIIDMMAIKDSRQQSYCGASLASLPPATWIALGLAAGVALLMFCMFCLWPVGTAQHFGSATILLLAAGTWIPFGSVLVYLGGYWRVPLITFALLAAIGFSTLNDNHSLRLLDAPPAPALNMPRPEIGPYFDAWLERVRTQLPGHERYPMVIVAAEGGGIRAAYWTATVLGQLQDQNPHFAAQVLAISGVSGGSLGAGVFGALLADGDANGARCRRDGNGPRLRSFRECAQQILAQDFLSPTLAAMLYPDLLQRFLPVGVSTFDRARALEQAWEHAWTLHAGSTRMTEPMQALWRESNGLPVPALIFNSTWVETGKRVLTSSLRIQSPPFHDTVDIYDVVNRDMRLSTAIHTSARFTYVSPAGTVRREDDSVWGHVVDGGYFENSGAATAIELLSAIREHSTPQQWNSVLPIVMVISNDPHLPPLDAPSLATVPAPRTLMNEVLSPVRTLLKTRDARGSYSRAALQYFVEADNYFGLGLCNDGMPLPLGWSLSDKAKTEIQRQLQADCGHWRNPNRLEQIRSRLLRGAATVVRAPL